MRRARLLVALGAAILTGSLFLPWYTNSVFTPLEGGGSTTVGVDIDPDGWSRFAAIDIVLTALAVAVTALAVVNARRTWPAMATAGAIATGLVAYRLIDPPRPKEVLISFEPGGRDLTDQLLNPTHGAYLALAAALLILAASSYAITQTREPTPT